MVMASVIACPICGLENGDDITICVQCKAFLQAKVDTLDLFATMWGMIESPGATLKKVVLSRTKNYVLILSVIVGVMLAFAYFWFYKIGNTIDGLFFILGLGILVGPLAGIIVMTTTAGLINSFSRVFGGRRSYRNTLGVISYSATPLILAFVLLFPVELAVFGQYFFGSNPHPMVIRPDLYMVLGGIHLLAFGWTIPLAITGTSLANTLSGPRAALVLLLSAGVFAGAVHAVTLLVAMSS